MSEPPDTATRERVVSFHYELFEADSERMLESSRQGSPVAVLLGRGNVIPGVEKALEGRAEGERFSVTVPPEEGYGARRDDWTQRLSRKHLAGAPKRLRPGMQVAVDTDQGLRPVTVVKVGATVVDVDLNHPMAGMTLRFDIEIIGLRAAEPEELAHGHVHGPGGHAH